MKLWTKRSRDKQEQHYQSVVRTLRDNHVDTADKAEACRVTMLNNARVYTLLALAVMVAFVILLPQTAPVSLTLFGCVVLWIWVTTLTGRKHVARFIDEELNESDQS